MSRRVACPRERAVVADLGSTYDDAFFRELASDVTSSAEAIVPIVCDLVHPRSVLDVGCGRGTWLRVFRDHGVSEIVGIDGPHVPLNALEIPRDNFLACDLQQPIRVEGTFDLVVSLEVAEHLDKSFATTFVESLVAHAPVVLFSAAIPFQGGAGHVNEAWQSTWAERFAACGYTPVDAIRPRIWRDERVAYWYAQNTLLYTDDAHLAKLAPNGGTPFPLDVVHPGLHVRTHTEPPKPAPPLSLSRVLRELPSATRRAATQRMRRPDANGV
jgi:SAM-dependent methyltransferase